MIQEERDKRFLERIKDDKEYPTDVIEEYYGNEKTTINVSQILREHSGQ